MTPAKFLALARELNHKIPKHAFLLTVGGQSFEHGRQLTGIVRQAVPRVCERIRLLLSGIILTE
jgi:hypothetical protein